MPQKRQTVVPEDRPTLVRSLGLKLPSGFRIDDHDHPTSQLVYATEGVLTVETGTGTWVVPPQRAVWIPTGFRHSIRTTGTVWMRTLYLREDLAGSLPKHCCILGVSPLLRELVLESLRRSMLYEDDPLDVRLAAVLVDQVSHTDESPLQLKLPSDPRAARVAERARSNLSRCFSIVELTKSSGASPRTIERLFRRETGFTLGRWLQRVRVLRSLECLAAGQSVTETALSVGYESTSAFIAMFKRVLGKTPGSYFSTRNYEPHELS